MEMTRQEEEYAIARKCRCCRRPYRIISRLRYPSQAEAQHGCDQLGQGAYAYDPVATQPGDTVAQVNARLREVTK